MSSVTMNVDPILIETAPDLAEVCNRWQALEAIGVDTEFVRERTFYPGLGLIQIGDGSACYLIDPVAISDLEPLRAVLSDSNVVKIFHSCGEDLEVLHHRFGEFPQAVFDTQGAAAFAGLGSSLGYARLVSAMFDVEVPKDKTRTNWLRRPLSDAQQAYAALDVAYLIPAYTRLRGRLQDLRRETWAREELKPLFDVKRFLPDPEDAYLRIGVRRSLGPRQLAVLRSLATWRENQARRQNLPRNFVLREKALIDVARRQPATPKALSTIPSLQPSELRRHGQILIRHVQRALNLPSAKLPRPEPALDLRPYQSKVQKLRALVGQIAEELSLPPELIATRKTIEKLVRRVVTDREPALPRELRGWRREPVGQRLLESL